MRDALLARDPALEETLLLSRSMVNGAMKWTTISTKRSMSFPHLEPLGCGMSVTTLAGLKLWFIGTCKEDKQPTSSKFLDAYEFQGAGKDITWEMVPLHEGDTL